MSSKHANQEPRRKASTKRFLVHSDDDDDEPVTQISKRPRTVRSDPPLSAATTPYDDGDMDVDVDTFRDSLPRSLSVTDDRDDHPTQVTTSKKRKKSTVSAASTKKKAPAYSDDDASHDHIDHDSLEDLTDLDSPLSSVSDSDPDIPPQRGASKATAGVTKRGPGKVKPGQLKGAIGSKDKERDREILMKDERRLAVPAATTSRASSAAAQSQPSDLFVNDDLASSSAVDSLPDATQSTKDPLSQTIPKKRKLPTIKKNKTTGSGTGTSTPTSTTQKPPPHVQELVKPSLPASEQRKQALTGVRDVDLGDSKIYAELFKGAGGNTPKSGLKNAEERRKELDRMRDEARAKRAEEMKFTFDLQSQSDKIARFEQRLRAENSTALLPNFLAAKFRDEWEQERRNKRATPKEEGEA